MIRIVSDSSTLYSSAQAKEKGFEAVPLQVIIDGQSWSDYEELSSEEMAEKCRNGAIPTTSQPNVARKLDVYNELLKNPEDQVLDLCMADGLSGTYQSACSIREMSDDPQRVTVFNTKTLCGPHRAMVETAKKLAERNASLEEILSVLETMQKKEASALMVRDFGFLQRGGRISKTTALAGSMLRLIPVVFKSDDGTRLDTAGACRTWQKGYEKILSFLKEHELDESWKLYIVHGDASDQARKAADWFAQRLPETVMEIHELCPMFLAHGGPGCLAIQAIRIPDMDQTPVA